MKTEKYTTLGIYKRVLWEVRPYWLHLTGIFVLGLLSTPIALLMPLPLKIVVDSVIGSHPLPGFVQDLVSSDVTGSKSVILGLALGLLLLVSLLGLFLNLGGWILGDYTGEKIVLHFRSRLFEHLQRLSLAYHDARGTADSTYRIQWDAPAIRWLPIDGVIPFVAAIFTLMAMIYVMARINHELALVALAVSPILILLNRLYSRRLRSQWREVKNSESSALAVVQEVLGAMRVVKAFGQEAREHARFQQESHPYIRKRVRVLFAESSFNLFVGLAVALGTAAVLFISVKAVQAGELTLGDLLLVLSYLAQLYAPLQTIGNQIATQQASLTSAERAFSLLGEPPDVVEREGAMPISRAQGAVEFRNLSFSYSDGQPVLRDISFAVPAGMRVGIAGRTGAGKTTLVSLLTRFYDPMTGRILLDGLDLRDYKLADLRDQFSIVLQEPLLFSSSIAANIAYARPDASMDEIVAAAAAANAHDFIVDLPEGYDTLVGERGMRLSGGERQRISLARAFLKDAPILILDEPTSSVDVRTEAAIMDAMERLMAGRTTFIVAHRPSTLEGCDIRLEMEEGHLKSVQDFHPDKTTRPTHSRQIFSEGRPMGNLPQDA